MRHCLLLGCDRSRIYLCNMKVKRVKDEGDVKKYGELCLHLKPSGRRRQWYIRADTPEELKAWKGVFKVKNGAARGGGLAQRWPPSLILHFVRGSLSLW